MKFTEDMVARSTDHFKLSVDKINYPDISADYYFGIDIRKPVLNQTHTIVATIASFDGKIIFKKIIDAQYTQLIKFIKNEFDISPKVFRNKEAIAESLVKLGYSLTFSTSVKYSYEGDFVRDLDEYQEAISNRNDLFKKDLFHVLGLECTPELSFLFYRANTAPYGYRRFLA